MTSGAASVRGGWSERHKWSEWNECTKRMCGERSTTQCNEWSEGAELHSWKVTSFGWVRGF